MQKNIILEISLAIFLIILSIFTGKAKIDKINPSFLKLPDMIDNIKGKPVILSEEEEKFTLSTGTIIIKEEYGPINLTLRSSSGETKLLHSPRLCYEGMGYLIYNEEIINITPKFKTVKMCVTKNNNKETIYYWFFNKNHKTTSILDVLIYSSGKEKDWSLISIAIPGEEYPKIKDIIIYTDKFLMEQMNK